MTTRRTVGGMSPAEAQCPVRPGDSCSLCHPGATGPHDCGLIWLVREDPDLYAEMQRLRREAREEKRRAQG